MMNEAEIRAELQKIKALKLKLEPQIWNDAKPVKDEEGIELSEGNIQLRIEQLANQLIETYPNEMPVLVALMDGALPFASALHKALDARNYPFQFTCMQVSSYRGGMSSGQLQIGSLPKIELGDRLVIIVDDVCDTGKTYGETKKLFEQQGAKEVQLMALVDKVQERALGNHPKFAGFKVSKDAFIIGYGLDLFGLLRNTKSIKNVNLDTFPTLEEQALIGTEKLLNQQLRDVMAAAKEAKSLRNSREGFFPGLNSILSPQTQTASEVAENKM